MLVTVFAGLVLVLAFPLFIVDSLVHHTIDALLGDVELSTNYQAEAP